MDNRTVFQSNKWVVLLAALVLWAGYFYGMDRLIMGAQGLPVQTNLMPK